MIFYHKQVRCKKYRCLFWSRFKLQQKINDVIALDCSWHVVAVWAKNSWYKKEKKDTKKGNRDKENTEDGW
jgi:hypothetical protein